MTSKSTRQFNSPNQQQMTTSNRICHYRTVFLGDLNVGKTSLIVRFARDETIDFQVPTIGVAFLPQTLTLDDATTVKFEIWDTSGQERYRSLAPTYYRSAVVAIVVFDITRKGSFIGAKSWVKEVQRRGDPNVMIAFVGNKADLEDQRQVQPEEAQQYALDHDIIYMETSAITGLNVRNLFVEIAKKLPKTDFAPEKEAFPPVPPKKVSGKCF